MSEAQDTALPYPHEPQEPPPLLVYQRSGVPLRSLAGGDLTVEDALVAYTVLQDRDGHRQHVSTTFLSIDASLGFAEEPQLWETVVHDGHSTWTVRRYAHEDDALTEHALLVRDLVDAVTVPREADAQTSAPPAPEEAADPPAEPGPALQQEQVTAP